MGSGKTTVGRLVAQALGRPFYDTDAHVEALTGREVVDFFAAGEEPEFRRREAEAVAELVERGGVVIALGGGALLDPSTRDLLLARTTLVHLDVSWPVLRERLTPLVATRPLLQGRSEAEIRQLYERRRATYAVAPVRVAVRRRTPPQVAGELVRRLGS